MAKYNSDYFVNEGNKIGYLRTQFDGTASNNLAVDKMVADGDLTKGQVVEVTGYDSTTRSIKVKATSAADSDMVLGVAMFDYKDGDPCSVETEGCFILEASAAITVPSKIASAAGGRVMALGDGVNPIGIALTPASALGDRIYCKFSI